MAAAAMITPMIAIVVVPANGDVEAGWSVKLGPFSELPDVLSCPVNGRMLALITSVPAA